MFEHIQNRFSFPKEIQARYRRNFTRISVPAKTILLKENQVSAIAYYIEKGIVRASYNHDGKDITLQFFMENTMFSSLESFRKGLPSMLSFETVEACILWKIDKPTADKILDEMYEEAELRNAFMDSIFERMFDYMKHFFSFIRDSPQERYLNLCRDNPDIIKRVPQHYIASYLGITTVHLSRIKAKILNKK
ncbi:MULTISPECIES: Crp/Fnr family transcriptional regulator [Chryseobacterium]|uniref:CRP-like cAMP-binding protein n=1 Tax=Chryseobacterium camelliae TaxID=1265445 RepID=A0ABU0TMI4_9FLAO|nr:MULTISPECIES: Crp/Fnr family transcriptional regulator [Chryseobacterium]MDT3407885.1 CRP-like cAMP-binding protein [Pseudacidovorax intermedius]MDQ1098260.1 CRP-like cAMP-binding protein [Chryseobacterium camelliae]MDQ1102186.1 CRP-like cAMP-binding protein [Chryseobacterium sp. SORGH_AS_1048]MDR6085624.1 CRP-like cAMP-binding protein [Chryseobacterium sp. SORGH_AS_0909]MDR6129988.1 CRP-like cAMP-binding protein [Chryseobacterium sp. SORGH_AS_1175]